MRYSKALPQPQLTEQDPWELQESVSLHISVQGLERASAKLWAEEVVLHNCKTTSVSGADVVRTGIAKLPKT